MKAEYINPFLESARIVIEQVANVRPSTGELGIRSMDDNGRYIRIHIGMTGQMQADIMFALQEDAALKMVSAMMGGYSVTEMDEMSQSAISELGNMISGNASTMLYNQGIRVDITPPKLMQAASMGTIRARRALTIPLIMDGIGELDIQLLIA